MVALGLREGASITEARAAYIQRTTNFRFDGVILGDEHLEKEFSKYYKSYITLLKYFSEAESEDVNDLSYYPQEQIVTFLVNQGIFHMIQQNYMRAMEKFQEAYNMDRTNEQVLLYMGIILVKRKNYYAAEKYFKDIIDGNRDNDDAWFQLGETYYKAGEYRKALNMYETAKQLDTTRKDAAQKIKELKPVVEGKMTMAQMTQGKKESWLGRLFKKEKKPPQP